MTRSLRSSVAVAALLIGFSGTASATFTQHYFVHGSLANQSSGSDHLWLTGETGEGALAPALGDNDSGSSFFLHSGSVFGPEGFFTGGVEYAGSLPTPGVAGVHSVAGLTAFLEVYGQFDPMPGTPLHMSEPSTMEIFSDQTVDFDFAYDDGLAGIRTIASGWILFSGDNPETFVGPGDLADHISFLMSLIPGAYHSVSYFDGEFVDLSGTPSGFGSFNGFVVTFVPLSAPVLLLASGLGLVFGIRKRGST